MYKKIYLLGLVAFCCMLVMAVIFYNERIICVDSAAYLFTILREGDFTIQHSRFIAVLTEIFPLVASKMSLPLRDVMIIYSVGFVIYQLTIYLICGFVLKDYRMGVVLLLFHILFATYSFYWGVSELLQGVPVMLLLFTCINAANHKRAITILLLFLFIPVIVFSHPLLLFPFGFALIFFLLDKQLSRREVIIVAGVFIATFIVKACFFREGYDTHSMSGLKHFLTLFPDYIFIYSNKVFLQHIVTKYYWIPICSTAILWVYFSRKQWHKILLFAVAMAGYLLLVNVSYPDSRTPSFYIENLYMPMGIFIGLPFVFDVLPVLEKRKLALLVAVLIIVAGLIRINAAHTGFKMRIDWERDFLNANKGRKIMMSSKYAPMDTLQMAWATPYEFWLLSTKDHDTTASIIINDAIEEVAWAKGEKKSFVTMWGICSYSSLNTRYFKMRDTTSEYTVIK